MICCICLAAGTVHFSRCFSFILGTFAAVLKQNEMRKMYLSAPLPFVGQKRMFAKEFIKVLGQFPDSTVFVDLVGGSGLLSHITKCVRPDAVVVYNDFDNYRQRLANIPATNVLLSDLRRIAEGEPRNQRITGEVRDKMFARIEREEKEHGYVDYITISASLLFAMKYVTCLKEMKKETIYNRIRRTDYPEAEDYLKGITVTSEDYKEVFKRYKDVPGVVFLVDPPYLSTEVGTYKMYWRLADYLDVLNVLKGHAFVYFTSNKSSILELCDWMGRNPFLGNPFRECRKVEFNASVNYNSKYTDMMLYTVPDEEQAIAA